MRNNTTPKFLLLVAMLQVGLCYGRSNIYPSGAIATAMNQAVTGQYHTWALAHNPAGLSETNNLILAIDYENRFMVPELSMYSMTALLPTPLGNLALLYSSFGPSWCRENQILIGYSRFLHPRLSCGIAFGWYGQKMPESGSLLGAVGVNLGVIAHASKNTRLGLSLSNPVSTPIETETWHEILPWKIRLGGNTNLSDDLEIGYETEIARNQSLLFRLGVNWNVMDSFFFRIGFDNRPGLSAGIGFTCKHLSIDLAFGYHPFLGYSPGISLQYEKP